MSDLDLQQRALAYAQNHELNLNERLGTGTDGTVWLTNRKSALKAFQYHKNYGMEPGCYQRLKEHGVIKLGIFAIPRLIEADDTLLVIEMSVVTPPYLIYFGKAYLDHEPQHSRETWSEHYQLQQEIWEDKLPQVNFLHWQLRQIGIYYRDAKPGNILFEDWNE